MIQERTILNVADNSGAKKVRCFRVLGSTRRRYAQLGDIIVTSVQSADPRKPVKKHDIVKAVVVRQRKPYRRLDGSYIRFDDNAVVLIDDKKEPRSTRIFGPIPKEIREKKYGSIVSIAKDVV